MAGLEELAFAVDEAQREARAIPQLTKDHPDLSVSDAYAIQALSVARRISRGEKRIGVKMGLTSRAKMAQVGVNEAAWGRLTDAMLLEEGGILKKSAFVHPRLEPEIVFLLKKRLSGKVSALEAMAAVEAIAPAMEVIDSRYENFKFTLPDVVADNTSSSGLVIGAWRSAEIDYSNLGMVLSVNGRPKEIVRGGPRPSGALARCRRTHDGGMGRGAGARSYRHGRRSDGGASRERRGNDLPRGPASRRRFHHGGGVR